MATSKPQPLDTGASDSTAGGYQGSAGPPPVLTPGQLAFANVQNDIQNFNKAVTQLGIGPGGATDPGKFVAKGGAIDPSHFKDSPGGQALGTAFGTLGNTLKDLNTAVRNLSDAGANTSTGLKDIGKYVPLIIIGLVVLVLMTVGKNSGVTISK